VPSAAVPLTAMSRSPPDSDGHGLLFGRRTGFELRFGGIHFPRPHKGVRRNQRHGDRQEQEHEFYVSHGIPLDREEYITGGGITLASNAAGSKI